VHNLEAESVTSLGVAGSSCRSSAMTTWIASKAFVHYSLLATVEAIFNLGTLGRNDTSATPVSDLFRGGIP
jgi:hypothetical protein